MKKHKAALINKFNLLLQHTKLMRRKDFYTALIQRTFYKPQSSEKKISYN